MTAPQWHDLLAQPTRSRPDYGIRRDLPLAALIVVVVAIAGVASGFIWHAVSARPRFLEGAGGTFQLPADTDKNYFGAEATFFAVTAAAGLVSGIATWSLGRRRGPAIAVGLALASVAAGLVTRAVGEAQVTNATLAHACGHDKGFDGICAVYNGHLELRVAGLTLTWAIMSLAVFFTLSAIAGRPRHQSPQWAQPSHDPWAPGFAPPPPMHAPPPPAQSWQQLPEPPQLWPPPPL